MGESSPVFSYVKKPDWTALSAPINKLKILPKSEIQFQFVDPAAIAFALVIRTRVQYELDLRTSNSRRQTGCFRKKTFRKPPTPNTQTLNCNTIGRSFWNQGIGLSQPILALIKKDC